MNLNFVFVVATLMTHRVATQNKHTSQSMGTVIRAFLVEHSVAIIIIDSTLAFKKRYDSATYASQGTTSTHCSCRLQLTLHAFNRKQRLLTNSAAELQFSRVSAGSRCQLILFGHPISSKVS